MQIEKPDRRFIGWMVPFSFLYVFGALFCWSFAGFLGGDNPVRYVIALLPMIPVIAWVVLYARYLREMDEMQRRIHYEASMFSAACVGLLSFAVGTLEVFGLTLRDGTLVLVAPGLVLFWGFGLILARRRYL